MTTILNKKHGYDWWYGYLVQTKMKQEITPVAIFASGTGSNAQKIIDYFKNSVTIKISLMILF